MTEPTGAIAAPEESLLIDVGTVAHLLSLSTRSVWRLLSADQLPQPVRIGRSVRWRRLEIEKWIRQGCPASDGGESRQ